MWKVTDDMPDPEKPEKDKIFYIRYLKNLNYHPGVPVYLELVKDTSASPALRKSLIESTCPNIRKISSPLAKDSCKIRQIHLISGKKC